MARKLLSVQTTAHCRPDARALRLAARPSAQGLLLRCVALLALLAVAACSARFDFREVRTADYLVALPGKPQTQTRDLDYTGPGGPAKLSMTMTSSGIGPTLFAVGAVTLPAAAVAPEQVDATAAWFRDALLRNVRGKLIAAQPVSVAAPAGRTLRLAQAVRAQGETPKDGTASRAGVAVVAARFIVVDDRLYQVVALGAENELTPAVLDTFFDSFRLL
jgi:hypothetical protein